MKKKVKMNKYQEAYLKLLSTFNNMQLGINNHNTLEITQSFNIVKELVDKAIPKKAKRRAILYCNCNNGESDHGFIYYCPVCNICDVENMNYCYDCGQALDWSDE